MKKVWAVLLAVSMFVLLAIPAFAEFSDSTESGSPEEITQLVFKQSSYTVKLDETIDLSQEVIAYCGSKKICQYPDLEFSVDSDNLIFTVYTNGKVTAFESSGTAVLTVKELTTGKTATCKLIAARASSSTSSAASDFKFSSSSYTFYTNCSPSEQTPIKVLPVNGTKFTEAQKTAINNAVVVDSDISIPLKMQEENGALLFYPTKVLTATSKRATARITVDKFPDTNKRLVKQFSLSIEAGSTAKNIGKKSNVKVEVGKTVDLNDYVIYNKSANVGKSCSFTLDFYNDNSSSMDYAVLGDDGHTIQGISVGRMKAVATLDGTGNSVELVVDVVARGSTSAVNASLTPSSGSVAVDSTLVITAKNIPEDADLLWYASNDSLVSMTEGTNNVTVKGLKAGTVTITLQVNGEDAAKATVTVTAASTSSGTSSGTVLPPVTPIVPNPSTGDSWFANLFF